MGILLKSSTVPFLFAALAVPAWSLSAQQQDPAAGDRITVTGAVPADLTGLTEGPEIEGIISARTGDQMNRFREFVKADWPFGEGANPEQGNVPPHWGEREPERDRPMHDATPELEAARKTLKDAIKRVRRADQEQQRKAAAVLQQAATALHALGDDEVDI